MKTYVLATLTIFLTSNIAQSINSPFYQVAESKCQFGTCSKCVDIDGASPCAGTGCYFSIPETPLRERDTYHCRGDIRDLVTKYPHCWSINKAGKQWSCNRCEYGYFIDPKTSHCSPNKIKNCIYETVDKQGIHRCKMCHGGFFAKSYTK